MADEVAESMACLRCGYELGAGRLDVCPECGEQADEVLRTAWAFRDSVSSKGSRFRGRLTAILLLTILAWGGLALYFFWWERPSLSRQAAMTVVALLILMGPSIVLAIAAEFAGPWAIMFLPFHNLPLRMTLWVKHLFWLHAPWLAVAPLIAARFAIVRLSGPSRELAGAATTGVWVAWLGVICLAGPVWWRRYHRDWDRCGLGHRLTPDPTVVAAILVFTCAGLWGAFGLVVFLRAAANQGI